MVRRDSTMCLSEERQLRGVVSRPRRWGQQQVKCVYVPKPQSPTAFPVRQRSTGVWRTKRQRLEVRATKVERSSMSRPGCGGREVIPVSNRGRYEASEWTMIGEKRHTLRSNEMEKASKAGT